MSDKVLVQIMFRINRGWASERNRRILFDDEFVNFSGETSGVKPTTYHYRQFGNIVKSPNKGLIVKLMRGVEQKPWDLYILFKAPHHVYIDWAEDRFHKWIATNALKEKLGALEIPATDFSTWSPNLTHTMIRVIAEEKAEEESRSLDRRRLQNTGNSCYFNSTMQALSASYPFYTRLCILDRLMKQTPSLFPDDPATKNEFRIFEGMTSTVMHLLGDSRTKIPSSMLLEIRRRVGKVNEGLDNDEQQDSHEYLTSLLGAVNDYFTAEERKRDTGFEVSTLNPAEVFTLDVERLLVCQGCETADLMRTAQKDVRLSVRENSSIQRMLATFGECARVERMCSLCDSELACSSERIALFPQSLIIHLERYEIRGNIQVKTDYSIKPTFEIDASSLGAHKKIPRPEELLADEEMESGGDMVCAENDVIVERIKMPKNFDFELLTDPKIVEEILNRLKISCDKKLMRYHLSLLEQEGVVRSVERTVPPGNTTTIKGDGNCFFRAVSWCLSGTQQHHFELRQRTVQYLRENEAHMKKYWRGDFGKHLEELEKDGAWATSCEIFALAKFLNINIYTFLPDSGWICHAPSRVPSENGSIYLKNLNNHFEPTISLANKEFVSGEKEVGNPVKKDKKDGMVAPSAPIPYDLVAVICHIGETPHSGHYVSYIRDFYDVEKWTYCSDCTIEEVPKSEVESETRETGYIYFYDRN